MQHNELAVLEGGWFKLVPCLAGVNLHHPLLRCLVHPVRKKTSYRRTRSFGVRAETIFVFFTFPTRQWLRDLPLSSPPPPTPASLDDSKAAPLTLNPKPRTLDPLLYLRHVLHTIYSVVFREGVVSHWCPHHHTCRRQSTQTLPDHSRVSFTVYMFHKSITAETQIRNCCRK